MRVEKPPVAWVIWLVAATGAFFATFALCASGVAGPKWAVPLQTSSAIGVLVFIALLLAGAWVIKRADRSTWLWAGAVGVLCASAELAGGALREHDRLGVLLDYPVWSSVHWLGVAWLAAAPVAALIAFVDRVVVVPGDTGTTTSRLARFIHRLNGPETKRRVIAVLVVSGVLALSRLLFFVLWWPGVVAFDTFRSYAYTRGVSAWDAYEPVGRTLQVAFSQWLADVFGLGDVGGVAISVVGQIVLDVAVCTLLLVRLAAWGAKRPLWIASIAWLSLSPVLVMSNVVMVKDVPFTACLTLFAVAIGELVFGKDPVPRWWPWLTIVIAGSAAIGLRNNGIYVVGLGLLLMLFPLRRYWKRILGSVAVIAVAFGLYSGPIYQLLHVQPGPKAETWSVPIQQMARIARDHAHELSAEDRAFLVDAFDGTSPEELGDIYVAQLSDPAKSAARAAWETHTASELLAGWAGLAARYPVTALEATLANTAGYWDPGSAPFEVLPIVSSNDVRSVHLDIPSGDSIGPLQSWLIDSGILPTHRSYATENDGYFAIPVLGRLAAPGIITWLWIVAAVIVVRRRTWASLAVFAPYAVLMLTLLAGPVSSQRYMLPFFAALPLAVAAAVLVPTTRRPGVDESPAPDPDDAGSTPPDPGLEPRNHRKSENNR